MGTRLAKWLTAALALACVVGCGRRKEEEEQPPEPECIRDAPEAPSCPDGFSVECDPEKPYPICVYDEGEEVGTARCTGAIGDLNFLPPTTTPSAWPSNGGPAAAPSFGSGGVQRAELERRDQRQGRRGVSRAASSLAFARDAVHPAVGSKLETGRLRVLEACDDFFGAVPEPGGEGVVLAVAAGTLGVALEETHERHGSYVAHAPRAVEAIGGEAGPLGIPPSGRQRGATHVTLARVYSVGCRHRTRRRSLRMSGARSLGRARTTAW
jgi:hypothetical protein